MHVLRFFILHKPRARARAWIASHSNFKKMIQMQMQDKTYSINPW
jgi:hypothetical protein